VLSPACFRRFEWHATISPAGREALQQAFASERSVRHGGYVTRQGERTSGLFCISHGWAARAQYLEDGSRQITAFLMEGDLCNPEAVFFAQAQQFVVALTPLRVSHARTEDLRQLLDTHHEVADAFHRSLLLDGLVSAAWLLNLGARDSEARLAHLLMELYTRSKMLGYASNQGCNLPLTQQELADSQGLTAVHVNRVLQSLRHARLISLRGGHLELLDLDELSRKAGFTDSYLVPS
jgi:CRP-like cAMP-binding protein